MDTEHRDLLIRIDANVSNLVSNFEKHLVDDDRRHQENLTKFDKLKVSQEFSSKIIYGIVGAFIFLEFLVKVFK